jgi:hypothetical protein
MRVLAPRASLCTRKRLPAWVWAGDTTGDPEPAVTRAVDVSAAGPTVQELSSEVHVADVAGRLLEEMHHHPPKRGWPSGWAANGVGRRRDPRA